MDIHEAIDHSLVRYAKENLWGSGITTIPAQFETAFDKLPPDDQQLVRAFFTAATISSLAVYMHTLGFGKEYLQNRLFDAGYREETPEKSWRPIFEYLSEMLPEDLHFRD